MRLRFSPQILSKATPKVWSVSYFSVVSRLGQRWEREGSWFSNINLQTRLRYTVLALTFRLPTSPVIRCLLPLDCGTQAFNSQDTAPSMPSPSNKSQITSAWTQSKPVMKPGASFNQEKQLEEHLLEPHGIDMRRHAHSC